MQSTCNKNTQQIKPSQDALSGSKVLFTEHKLSTSYYQGLTTYFYQTTETTNSGTVVLLNQVLQLLPHWQMEASTASFLTNPESACFKGPILPFGDASQEIEQHSFGEGR